MPVPVTVWLGDHCAFAISGAETASPAECVNCTAALVGFQTTRWFGDKFRAEHPEVVRESVAVFQKNDVKAYVETCKMLGAL